MRKSVVGSVLLCAGVIMACGGDDGGDAEPTPTPTEVASTDDDVDEADAVEDDPAVDDAPSDDEGPVGDDGTGDDLFDPSEVSFTYCSTGSPDVALLNLFETIERMEARGYSIDMPFLDTELCTDGVIRGEFQMGLAINVALIAYEQGADNLQLIGNRNLRDELIIAQEGINSCNDLDGRTYAVHSPGSLMAGLFRAFVADECDDDVDIEVIVIAGSGNRAQALINGQIDATGVATQDIPILERDYAGQYNVLREVSDVSPWLGTATAIYVDGDWASENRPAVVEFLRHMNEAAQEWDADPDAYREAISRHVPDLADDLADFFAYELGAAGLFPLYGGITVDGVADAIEFYATTDVIEGNVTADEIVDLSYLEEALAQLDAEIQLQNP